MVTADIAENDLIEILKGFNIFERNKVSLVIKLVAVAMYLLSSSFRRIASLRKINRYWVDRFKDAQYSKEKVKSL